MMYLREVLIRSGVVSKLQLFTHILLAFQQSGEGAFLLLAASRGEGRRALTGLRFPNPAWRK